MIRKIRNAIAITQDNDCSCHGTNRKQNSRYNKSAKRQSSRKARLLDKRVIEEQVTGKAKGF